MVGVIASCISRPNGGVWDSGVPPEKGSEDRRLEEWEWDLGRCGYCSPCVGGELAMTSLPLTDGVLILELREVGGAW